jgi:DNA-binding MarR family transcriptional regulator
MNVENTQVKTEETKPAAKAVAKKVGVKAATQTTPREGILKKAAKKAPVKKAAPVKEAPATKKVAKKATDTQAPKEKSGLRKPQIKILLTLAKKDEVTRAQLAEKAGVDTAGMVEWMGSLNPEKRAANDVKHFPSLLTLGLVKAEQHDVDGKDTVLYFLSAKGKAAVAKLA